MNHRGTARPLRPLPSACALAAALLAMALLAVACAPSESGPVSASSATDAVASSVQSAEASLEETPPEEEASAPSSQQAPDPSVSASLADLAAANTAQPVEFPAGSELVVRFLSVGQGDCAILSCDGHHALIDGGPEDASQVVYTVLRNLGVDHLDFIVATHPDADHIGGISGALNFASCATCYCSATESDTETFADMKRYLEKGGGALVVPQVPTALQLGGATCTIIGPTRHFDDDNNGSLVCRVDFGQTSFLFMGDAGYDAERALMASGANVKANVLKVGHHGSRGATGTSFLKRVDPQAAIISVGKGNEYGHPTKEVLDALSAQNVEIYRTDQMGDIVATSDGSEVLFSTGAKRASGMGVATGATGEAAAGEDAPAPAADPTEPGGAGEYKYADMKEFMDALPEGTVLVQNTSSGKYHYLDCKSLKSMKGKNAQAITSWDDVPADFDACGNCKPKRPE